MSVKDRGFASASKERRKDLSSRGGKKAHELGRAHTWSSQEASAAALKGVARRKERQALAAALYLLQHDGITPEGLNALKLSHDEYIYYGGAKSTKERRDHLRNRIAGYLLPEEEKVV